MKCTVHSHFTRIYFTRIQSYAVTQSRTFLIIGGQKISVHYENITQKTTNNRRTRSKKRENCSIINEPIAIKDAHAYVLKNKESPKKIRTLELK